MLVPTVAVVVPSYAALAVSTTFLLGRQAVIVNSEVEASGGVRPAYVVGIVMLACLAGLGLVVGGAAVRVMTAGVLLGRPVPPAAVRGGAAAVAGGAGPLGRGPDIG